MTDQPAALNDWLRVAGDTIRRDGPPPDTHNLVAYVVAFIDLNTHTEEARQLLRRAERLAHDTLGFTEHDLDRLDDRWDDRFATLLVEHAAAGTLPADWRDLDPTGTWTDDDSWLDTPLVAAGYAVMVDHPHGDYARPSDHPDAQAVWANLWPGCTDEVLVPPPCTSPRLEAGAVTGNASRHAVTADRWTYVAGRVGALLMVKVGGSSDLPRRCRSIGEDRTLTPPLARHRRVIVLAAWPESDGPSEADLLDAFTEARWRAPTGHLSEYARTDDPDVAALLDSRCPGWREVLRHEPGCLAPIRVDRSAAP